MESVFGGVHVPPPGVAAEPLLEHAAKVATSATLSAAAERLSNLRCNFGPLSMDRRLIALGGLKIGLRWSGQPKRFHGTCATDELNPSRGPVKVASDLRSSGRSTRGIDLPFPAWRVN